MMPIKLKFFSILRLLVALNIITAMPSSQKITEVDLYGLFDVLPSATESEIKKAYRKKALKCHPDKNPDNPKAKELFQQLSDALEILTDPKAKAAYDTTLKAKEQARIRHKQLDAKRRKLKEDLEEREKAFRGKSAQKSAQDSKISNEARLLNEIERLRKEGSNTLREEQETMRKLILQERTGGFLSKNDNEQTSTTASTNTPQVKVRWSSTESYDEEKLKNIFGKFGKLLTVVVLKKCSLIEFSDQNDAEDAYEHVKKSIPNLQIEWVSKSNSKASESKPKAHIVAPSSSSNIINPQTGRTNNSSASFFDFEADILKKLSQAAAAQKN